MPAPDAGSRVADLTRRIAAGDRDAFVELYHGRFDSMTEEARRATGRDESFCLDVVQDAMMRVIRSIPTLPDDPALTAWLRRTVRSCAYDQLRAERRRERRERAAARPERAPDAGAERDHRIAALRRELAVLDDETSALLVMRHRFGWTLDHIGRAIGLSTGAVDGRLRRAAAALGARARESRP